MSGDLIQALLLFAGSSILVIVCGLFLAKYGDTLAELMGWGKLWVGTILVASATSLPELITTVTAAIRNQPELAGGNILGSNMVNMFALAMVALLFGAPRFFQGVVPEQRFVALAAIALTGLAVVLGAFDLGVSVLEVGLASVLILTLYLGGMRLVYVTRPKMGSGAEADLSGGRPGLRRAWILFGLASLGIIVAAPALAFSAEQIVEETGLAASFVGVVAVALVTTLPEAATIVAAVRLGAADLAVGNLYGSCAFNVLTLAVADPFYREGTLVETLGAEHVAAGLVATLLMSLGLSQILLRGSYPYLPVRPTLVAMGLIYFGGLYLVFALS